MIKYLNTENRLQFWKIWKQSDNSIVIQEGKVGECGVTRRIPFNKSTEASDFMWQKATAKADFNFNPPKQIVEIKIRLKSADEIKQIEEQLKLYEDIGYLLEDTGNGELGDGGEANGLYHLQAEVVDLATAKTQISEELKKLNYEYNFKI